METITRILSGVLIGAVAWIWFLLPARARRLFEGGWARLFDRLRWRAEVIDQNLEYARRANAISPSLDRLAAYRHMAQLFGEILFLFGPMKRFLKKEVVLEGVEHYRAAHAKGNGVILLASHIGNWETMAAKGAVDAGIEIMLVTKHLKPEWVHQLVERARARVGVSGTYEPRTFRDVLRQLKANRAVGFVIDQYTGAPVGVRVPFFGIPVGTQSAVALIAKRTGAPVLPVLNTLDRTTGIRTVRIEAPIDWQDHMNAEYAIALNTFRYSREIEKHIVGAPAQWLWTHRRFKGDLSPLRPGEWTAGRART